MRFIKSLIIFVVLIILFSCGNEAPYIEFPVYNILIYQEGALSMYDDSIFLSLYFILFDDDGNDDIAEVKITHTKTQYSWTIPISELEIYDYDNKSYYGVSFLEYDGAKSILLGEYVVSVVDKAGAYSEIKIIVEIDNKNEIYDIPPIDYSITFNKENNEFKIDGDEYNSVELKFINDPSMFDGGRKKFFSGDKIILDGINSNYIASFRVNKDINETIIYFLRNYSVE